MLYFFAVKEITISSAYLVIMVIVLAIIISFSLLVYRTFLQKIIKEKSIQHELEIEYQKNILNEQIRVQESERERIAIQLHDDVGNRLNILSVWLRDPDMWNSERSREIINSQLPELIDATRNISHSLYPVNLEKFGLIITLEEMISHVGESLRILLITIHEYQKKETAFEVQLYRIIQEFTGNVIKHSKASEMSIYLRDSVGSLAVILSDNGIGFDLNSRKSGMGLQNIALRIRTLHASHKWKSTDNQGCRLILIIPKP
ncbi:sensor histidine kinase [Sinomicrobium sp. M5D2P17]